MDNLQDREIKKKKLGHFHYTSLLQALTMIMGNNWESWGCSPCKSWLRVTCIIIFVSKQFSVPGNNIVLSPELYITVLAYTSILNPEAPQVS